MNIVIAGAGVVGTAVAEQLSHEGHQVVVIDNDRRVLRRAEDRLDVLCVHGNASSPSTLKKAGLAQAHMLIAVTPIDEVNIVVGMLAKRVGVKTRLVRLRNIEYSREPVFSFLKESGIEHIINPDPTIVNALVRMLEIPGTNDIATLAGGEILMIGVEIPEDSPTAGRSLAEIRDLGALDTFIILNITRGDDVFVPSGEDQLQVGDHARLLVARDMVPFMVPMIHREPKQTRTVIISGANRLGLELAEALVDKVQKLVIIEPNVDLAEEAANFVEKAMVLTGDPTDLEVLEEASIDLADLFCAVMEDDQKNFLSALLAKKHGAAKSAVLVRQPDYISVLDSLGSDIVINPRLVTVGEIMAHVRKGHIHSVTQMAKTKAEVLEMVAPADSPIIKEPLRNIKFPKNAIVGAIVRDGLMQLPVGETQIQPGETCIVYTLPEGISKIEKLFTSRK